MLLDWFIIPMLLVAGSLSRPLSTPVILYRQANSGTPGRASVSTTATQSAALSTLKLAAWITPASTGAASVCVVIAYLVVYFKLKTHRMKKFKGLEQKDTDKEGEDEESDYNEDEPPHPSVSLTPLQKSALSPASIANSQLSRLDLGLLDDNGDIDKLPETLLLGERDEDDDIRPRTDAGTSSRTNVGRPKSRPKSRPKHPEMTSNTQRSSESMSQPPMAPSNRRGGDLCTDDELSLTQPPSSLVDGGSGSGSGGSVTPVSSTPAKTPAQPTSLISNLPTATSRRPASSGASSGKSSTGVATLDNKTNAKKASGAKSGKSSSAVAALSRKTNSGRGAKRATNGAKSGKSSSTVAALSRKASGAGGKRANAAKSGKLSSVVGRKTDTRTNLARSGKSSSYGGKRTTIGGAKSGKSSSTSCKRVGGAATDVKTTNSGVKKASGAAASNSKASVVGVRKKSSSAHHSAANVGSSRDSFRRHNSD